MTVLLDPQIRLKTSRCILRRIDVEDAPSVYSALSTPGFTDGLLQECLTNHEEAVALIEKLQSAWSGGARFAFAITSGAGEFLGFINLFTKDEPGWRLGFWIMPEHWGNGYAEEAARVVIDLAFDQLGAETVRAAHLHWNTQSARVL